MADLTARFRLIDDMSAKLDDVGQRGEQMVDTMEEIGVAAESAFDEVKSGSAEAAEAVDGVAVAVTTTAEKATSMGTEVAEAVDKVTKQTEELGDTTEKLGKKSKDTGDESVDAIEALSNALQGAGIAMMLNEIMDAFTACSEAASAVETEAAKISTIADNTQMSLMKINQSTVALSNDTGKAATALLDSVYNSISAGVQTASAVEFAGKANKLAVGGFTDATTAVDVLTTAINAYGLSVNDAAQISDYLIVTQNLGKSTVDELASSVGNVIPLAAAYGVEMDNLSTAYAIMTSNGIATAETGTYLKSILSELGDTGSEVSKILVDQTGNSFAGLTAEGYSLGEILDVLGDSVNGDATAFANLWASTEAGIGALSLFNSGAERYNSVLEEMANSAGATEKAYQTMADTTETAHERMTNSATNLQVAIGSALNPTLADLYNGIADVTGAAGEFVAEHPGMVKAVTAVAVGLGTATSAVLGFMALKTITPMVVDFGVKLNAALGPIGWVSIGITGVVAAGTALIAMLDDAVDETYEMTATTRAQYLELQELETAYKDACDTYGDTSEEASRLRYQVEDLSTSFDRNRQTVDEFAAECQSVIDAHDEMANRFDESTDKIDDFETSTFALIQKLEDWSDGTYTTAHSQAAMRAIIDELNGSIDGLNLNYLDVISNQEGVIQSIREMAEAEAEQQRQQEAYTEYVELLKQQAIEEEQLARATEEVTAEQERYNEALANYNAIYDPAKDTTGFGWLGASLTEEHAALQQTTESLGELTDKQAGLQASLDDTNARILEIEESWGLTAEAVEGYTEATMTWEEASKIAFASVQTEMEALVQEYGEVYDSALESFEGQFELFDKASTKSEDYLTSTVAKAQAALDSQLAYWESYSANIETLQGVTAEQLGITQENYEALMAYVQDGSEQAAGLAASMVKQIESGNAEAVAELADTLADVTATREEIATKTAEWVTDFSTKMDELTAKMEDTIDGLNLDDEAAEAAKDTIQAYADAILANRSAAVDAATQIANAVSAALSASTPRINVAVNDFTPRHATGTTHAEDAFIAGENGAELILDHEGATVFPASETERIINAVNAMNGVTSVSFADEFFAAVEQFAARRAEAPGTVLASPQRASDPVSSPRSIQGQEKTIRLEIAGSGSMAINPGTNKDEVVEILLTNLKPALLSIVQEEIFEEGDSSYDF